MAQPGQRRARRARAPRRGSARTSAGAGALVTAIAATLDLASVLQRVVDAARELCRSDLAHIALREPGSEALTFRYWSGARRRGPQPFRVEPGRGLGGRVLLTGRPCRTSRYARDRRLSRDYVATVAAEGIVGSMAAPIRIGDRIEGLLFVDSRRRAFTAAEEGALVRLAAQAATAIANARLYQESERRRRAAESLADLGQVISQSLDGHEVARRVVDSLRTLLDAEAAVLYGLDAATGELTALAVAGDVGPTEGRPLVVPPGAGLSGRALRERGPVVTADLLSDPRITLTDEMRARIRSSPYRAAVALPLVVPDRIIGTLSIGAPAGREFDADEVRLAQTFGNQAALALERARLFAETRDRLTETETLLAVGRALSLKLPIQEAMRRVAREVARAFHADMAGAYFLDARKEALLPIAGYRVRPDLLSTLLRTAFPLARFPFLQEAWTTRRPVWTSDYARDPRFSRDLVAPREPGAMLFAPTLVRGEIDGGLFLLWWAPGRAFTPAELRLIEGVASQVGLALENVELVRDTEEKLRVTEILLSVSRALSSTLDLEPLLRHFLRQVARTIQADSVGVWLEDPATGSFEPLMGYHVPRHLVDALRRYRVDPAESRFYAEGIALRRPVASSDAPEDPRLSAALQAIAPHRAQLFVPIVAKDRVIGAFIAVWWEQAREISERELSLIETMGSQAAVAIDNARLFRENQRKLDELSALHELSQTVTGQVDLAALVQAVRRGVGRVLNAHHIVILLYDASRREFEVALQLLDGAPDPNPIRRYRLGHGLMTRVVEGRQAFRTTDYVESCRRAGVEPIPTSSRFRHWLGVPMIAGEEVLGVLALRDPERAFTDADERLLTNVAGLVALSVRNARLFEEKARVFDDLAAAQDRLIRTEKLRALGEMAGGVAHDFNNLLAIILARTQILVAQTAEPTIRRQLEIIERAALDGAQTVRRIQEFTGTRRMRTFMAVDLNRVVQDVVEVTRARWKDEAEARGQRFEVLVEAVAIPPVAGDPVELREALTNLVFNALDAMPDGGRLTLRTGLDGHRVFCAVADTGVGMSEEVRGRVFDPFFTTKDERGTGLGLSMVYGIVTRHGGEIEVASQVGRGSAFTIRLPVADELPPTPATAAAPAQCPAARILVIDDEPEVRAVLTDLLRAQGHEVASSGDGRSGLARFEAERFDLVFTDLGMPGLSGWDVARIVKARRAETPVVLVTGWGDQLEPTDARRRGVEFVVAKPFEAGRLRGVVGEALARIARPVPAEPAGGGA